MKQGLFNLLLLVLCVFSLDATGGQLGILIYEISGGQVTISHRNLYVDDKGPFADGNLNIPSEIEGLPVTRIGDHAFNNFRTLTSITIPDTVTSIGENAFRACPLSSITIPDSVTSIGPAAFEECRQLTSITIPKSVTSIGERVFWKCSSLTSIDVHPSNPKYTSIDGVLMKPFLNNSLYLVCYPAGKKEVSYTLPLPVTSIETHAFSACENLTSITFTDRPFTDHWLYRIGVGAFSSCSSLTSITLPNSIRRIESHAFYHCESLTSITIPDGVNSIGDMAFQHCSSLTSVTLPNSITHFGEKVFEGCPELSDESILSILAIANRSLLVINNGEIVRIKPGSDLNGAISIPAGIIRIGNNAFSGCSNLTSIEIPDSVTSIGAWAFDGCSSLTSIEIPNSVTQIGHWAFRGCSELGSVIVNRLFHNKQEAQRISLARIWPDGLHLWQTERPLFYDIEDGQAVIADCEQTASGSLIIPDQIDGLTVRKIRRAAFHSCNNVTSIMIPESIKTIGSEAFYGCSNLTSINIPKGVTKIEKNAFRGCGSLTSISIPNSVTTLGDHAFWHCNSLTSITIPESVTSIGDRAFYKCLNLTSITIPNSVTSIGNGAFSWCLNLTSIEIPESVTFMGNHIFEKCPLTSLTIPNSFHNLSDATRLYAYKIWPDGFHLPSKLSIRIPLRLIMTRKRNTEAVIETADSVTGPWTEWRTVVIGEQGTAEVDLDEGAEKRFYRVRD